MTYQRGLLPMLFHSQQHVESVCNSATGRPDLQDNARLHFENLSRGDGIISVYQSKGTKDYSF